ncbi:hypothetical protein BHE74_00005272 [Ensete ventricosum]|nr:hypothetical protein BHE74_00005272 [Ensete ventricosum]
MDLNVLRKKPRMPRGKSTPTAGLESAQPEGSSRRATRDRELEVSAEDSSPTYHRPKSMKDLCGMRFREDDKGYYILQMAD